MTSRKFQIASRLHMRLIEQVPKLPRRFGIEQREENAKLSRYYFVSLFGFGAWKPAAAVSFLADLLR
jgi:hypothetical protein